MTTPTVPRARAIWPGPRPVLTAPRVAPLARSHLGSLVADVMAGREPAEVLPGPERAAVMAAWVAAGWPDVAIAAHSRWSLYTVARIRSALGLAANPDPDRSPT